MKTIVAAISGARFNHTLHYRYADVGEVLAYIVRNRPDDTVEFYDNFAYEIDWNLLRALSSGVDAVVFFVDVPSAPSVLRLARMAREIAPALHIVAFGKATLAMPAYFTRAPFDAVYLSGDQEAAVLSCLNFLDGGDAPSGAWCSRDAAQHQVGIRLEVPQWEYPLLAKLPLEHYRRIAVAKGIPFEMSVYPSKGCHHQCPYCDASLHEGLEDRRRDPEELLDWAESAVREYGFELVQMHSANFAADPQWVSMFCSQYRAKQNAFRWTCCTRPETLTRDMIHDMAHAGCARIGIGVESIHHASCEGIKTSAAQLEEISPWIAESTLSCKAYIMAGMPGQTERDLLHTYLFALRLQMTPRVSTYTPFHMLHALDASALDRMDLSHYDRKSFHPETNIPYSSILKLVLRPPGVEQWAQERHDQILRNEGVS